MSQLGRISGPILTSNLERNGEDLAFQNNPGPDVILQLDVNNSRIGVNQADPTTDLNIDGYVKTTDLIVDDQAIFDNLIFNANGTISTVVGAINISPAGAGAVINLDRVLTAQLEINGNVIKNYTTNGSVVLNPNASGSINIQSSTSILGNLTVTGNTILTGDLSAADNIIVGDSPVDVVTVAPDFTQDIIPGTDNTYDLGQSAKRWSQLHVTDDLTHANLVLPQAVTISDQIRLDGVTGQIISIQSNDDILITPFTGITVIERTQWQNNTVTNLNNSAITIASTATGYLKYQGTNGFVVPAGSDLEQRASPEVGETRWNTDQQYLECFDGTVWVVSIGGGPVVTPTDMEDLSTLYTIVFG